MKDKDEYTDEEAKKVAHELYLADLEKARETEDPIPLVDADDNPVAAQIIEDLSADEFEDEDDAE